MKQVTKLIKSEKGIALSIALVLLALGGLVITPLLFHLYTGVSSEKIYRERMKLNYAVDAGVEDGIWKADNDAVPLDPFDYTTVYSYTLPTAINDKDVNVDIQQVWLLDGLESDINGTTPAIPPLSITGGVINSEGDFEIRLGYDMPEVELLVDSVAVWLPPDFAYVNNSSDIITEENPTQTVWNGGTVLRWDFYPAVNFDDLPTITSGDPGEGGLQPAIELPSVRILSFKVTPEGELARGSYCWFRTEDPNNYLCFDSNITIYQINATATDNATGAAMTAQGYSYVSKGFDTGWLDMGETLMSGDYRAIGNTNMQDLNLDRRRETVVDESSATINNIPSDASVVYAFLYWSGWKDYSGSMEPDKQVLFRVEAAPDFLLPNTVGNYTECDPVGAANNFQCTNEVVSDEDTTYVQTGYSPEVLRPNGSGTYTQCSRQPGYSNNWQCVDEETPDDGSTYVYTEWGDTERDTYNLQNHTSGNGTINSVTVHIRSRSTSYWQNKRFETMIRTYGNSYYGTETWVGNSWTDLSTTYNTNPSNGQPWTWSQIDALEAGVRQYDLGYYGDAQTTQVYVEVDYGPTGEEEKDTYQLSDLTELPAAISSITVYTETKGTTSPDTHVAQTIIRTHGTDYYGANTTLPTSYTTVSTTYTNNPFTGNAWTLNELNDLEAGVKHYDNGSGSVRTTKVYIEVTYNILVEETITASKWWLMENQAPDYAYSCFKDVTSIVSSATTTGNAYYTVGGVYGSTGSELSYAGWSLILIYSSPSEMGTQFYLYDSLTFAGTDATGTFLVEGFVAPGDAQATLTCFVGEGDDWYDNDSLQFNGNYLSDATNPWNDVWNGKSSGLAGEQIDGVDIDTFDVSSPIINPGDSSANLTYTTQQDNWDLIYHILAFRSDQGVLTPSGTGVFSWD